MPITTDESGKQSIIDLASKVEFQQLSVFGASTTKLIDGNEKETECLIVELPPEADPLVYGRLLSEMPMLIKLLAQLLQEQPCDVS
jgi:hypothetical protein